MTLNTATLLLQTIELSTATVIAGGATKVAVTADRTLSQVPLNSET